MKYLSFLFILISITAQAQQGKLIAGPMQGSTTAHSAKVWMMVEKAKKVEITLSNTELKQNFTKIVSTDSLLKFKDQFPFNIEFIGLNPNTEYCLKVSIDKTPIKKIFKIKTFKDSAIADFSFLEGSCALIISPWLKPIVRVGTDKVEDYMRTVPSDFMLWLGDNFYYHKKDFASPEGMWNRQIKTRKRRAMNDFLMDRPQYAIWDDHDYGSYDGDSSFEFKDTSLTMFKNFWPNGSYGTPEIKGTFTHFRMYDAEFILTDDRFYRSPSHTKNRAGTMLGKKQLAWVFETLKKSDATFKFVAIGSQMLNLCNDEECYSEYPDEKQEIIDFIKKNHITGVVFLTGDTHYSELLKFTQPDSYPLYDFTCSPISSFLGEYSEAEKTNPMRVPNTWVHHRNFSRISIKGQKNNRTCLIEVFDDSAKPLWKYSIPEKELR